MSDGFIQASHGQSKHCPRVMCGQNMAPSLLDEPQGSFNDAKDPHMRPYTESAALGLLPTGDTHQLGELSRATVLCRAWYHLSSPGYALDCRS